MNKIFYRMILMVVFFTGCSIEDSASIRIIGGADGPTSIYVIEKAHWVGIVSIIIVVIILTLLAVLYFFKKRK